MSPTVADFLRAFVRSFASQASWNPRTYVSGGLAYSLLPLLVRIHAGHPVRLVDSLARHLEPFNAHPYLAPMAVGALARLERDGASPDEIRRFRDALSAALGSVGDALIWSAWRPLCLLCGLLAYTLGASPWMAILVFLIPYNLGHLAVRTWSFRRGWVAGHEVGAVLSGPGLQRLIRRLRAAALVLLGAGVAAAGLLVGGEAAAAGALAAVGAAAAGYLRPRLACGLALAVLAAVVALRFWVG